MAVAPLLTTKYPHLSDWSMEPPVTAQKSSLPDTQNDNNAPQNPVESKNYQQQPVSFYLPVVVGITIGLIIGGIALGAIVTLWLTAPAKATTAIPIVTAFWSFDNNANDQYNVYNGVPINAPSYVTGYTNLSSTALSLNDASSQYVSVASPFLNLTYRSFTIEIWFYPTILTSSDYGLFGQCQTASMDLCLMYMIRNYGAYLGFDSDDLSGVTVLSNNTWYHVAFVYNYLTSTQSIYLNGVIENSRSSNSYKGMTGSILIGAIDNGGKYYFTGYIDQVLLVTQAKTAVDILNDATLVCYYSFDSSPYVDSGPLGLNASVVNVSTTSSNGRINNAIAFTSASSYLVIGGLTKLGSFASSYSISIWINPTSLIGGTIIHISRCNYQCGLDWCLAFIGLTLTGQIVIQSWNTIVTNGSPLVSLTGPILSTNVWTHVAQTYSLNNGMCLYVNGLLINQTTAFTYAASNTPVYLYLGSFPVPACVALNVISQGQYYGLLDEFRVFSRELTAGEVYALANP